MWRPIENLSPDWRRLAHPDLQSLANIWLEQRKRLEETQNYQRFLEKLRRKIAIETGLIERLYTLDRGITHMLIEHGIHASLIPHGKSDKPPTQIVQIISDHEEAMEHVFDYVGSQRDLSVSFIKQLHQLLTRNQPYTEAIDPFGKVGKVELIRGDWKRLPNNPTRPDGSIHPYCPPEQVASQMDQLVAWHLQHLKEDVTPEVEAAWLHHRFTQIHPFQDGNGRVARALATLVFIKKHWFPLAVLDDRRDENDARHQYISALESADDGDLKPLVDLFASAQRQSFLTSLSLSETVLAEDASYQHVLQSVVKQIEKRGIAHLADAIQKVEERARSLHRIAKERLKDVEREIEVALKKVTTDSFVVRLDDANADDERAYYYRYQIIETAKILGYYANLNLYKSWLRLLLRVEGVQTELLLSFHVVGYEHRGVMVCSACGYRKLSADEGDLSTIQEIEPLSSAYYSFTYQDEQERLQNDFRKWLEAVIVAGLAYWRKGL